MDYTDSVLVCVTGDVSILGMLNWLHVDMVIGSTGTGPGTKIVDLVCNSLIHSEISILT